MGKRVTIIIDDYLDKRLRHIQAKMIAKNCDSISFSRVVNQQLRKQLK